MLVENDGLVIPEVGAWARDKYAHVQTYCSMFTGAMKPPKWQALVYIDLFAGAGLGKIKGTSEIVATSALLAIDIPVRFSRYIFCDINDDNVVALHKRVSRFFPDVDCRFLCCEVNTSVDRIIAEMPAAGKDNKVLAFCFVDPFKLDDLAFSTIEGLSKRFMDFLVLVATDMDANRNVSPYMAPESATVARFTGKKDWRTRWDPQSNKSFGLFVLGEFSAHMQDLNYKPQPVEESVLVRNLQKNAPLYRLAYFSRHDLGKKFWRETKKSADPQLNLFQ